ncbi:carbohydrate ABC transporter permease [Mangrovihabitans endophyticus]|uniref:Transporter n=1 Tax=Mangrovihabitans endophyticus TaxID=1751298 RepID=A0A8J3BUA3_9ACTN|nr:sugar ABC transporter permease [Mangrovihabitans endophyticus]GGK78497.1 transporter [Mangrovihabitans endophyticus]
MTTTPHAAHGFVDEPGAGTSDKPATTPAGGRRTRRDKLLVLLATPAVLWYAVFTIGPLGAVFYIALLDWEGLLSPSTFVGLDNFTKILHDPVFWTAAKNSLIQIGVVIPVMIPLAFMLGYYLTLEPRGHHLLRVILFTPALVSLSAKAMVFLAVFAPSGALNGLLDLLHLDSLTRPWLANEATALPSVIAVDLWSGIGFTAILFSARLSSISREVYEAARIDGAGHWRRMWRIAFPMTEDYFGVLAMLQFLWVLFSSAGSVLLLTGGGPGNASTTLSFLIYDKAFTQSEVGYSQATGVLLFFVGVVGMAGIRSLFRQRY